MSLGLLLPAWDRFGISMGSLLHYIGVALGFWGWLMVILASAWDELGSLWGHSGAHWGDFGVTLGWLGVTLGSLRRTLEWLWRHFGVTWADCGAFLGRRGRLWSTLGRFERTLGTVWDPLRSPGGSFCDVAVPLGYLRMTLESLWNYFGCTVSMREWHWDHYNSIWDAYKWIWKNIS